MTASMSMVWRAGSRAAGGGPRGGGGRSGGGGGGGGGGRRLGPQLGAGAALARGGEPPPVHYLDVVGVFGFLGHGWKGECSIRPPARQANAGAAALVCHSEPLTALAARNLFRAARRDPS